MSDMDNFERFAEHFEKARALEPEWGLPEESLDQVPMPLVFAETMRQNPYRWARLPFWLVGGDGSEEDAVSLARSINIGKTVLGLNFVAMPWENPGDIASVYVIYIPEVNFDHKG